MSTSFRFFSIRCNVIEKKTTQCNKMHAQISNISFSSYILPLCYMLCGIVYIMLYLFFCYCYKKNIILLVLLVLLLFFNRC